MLTVHQLSKDFYLFKSHETDFNRNIYLRIYRDGDKSINLLMDPGSRQDLEPLSAVLQKLIGGVKNLSAIFLSHQDPDLTGNLSALLQYSSAYVFTSEDTWRILRTAGYDDKRFIATESFRDGLMKMKGGYILQFIHAYFCHFRGATMLYDRESGILFTGDFLGGVITRQGEGFLANEDSLPGVITFHRLYMPTQKAMQETIQRISKINPPPLYLAPQHGDIVRADLAGLFLKKLYDLPVGIDTIAEADIPNEVLTKIFNRALSSLKSTDELLSSEFIKMLRDGGNFTPYFTFSGNLVNQVKVDYYAATDVFVKALTDLLPTAIADQVKIALFNEISELGLKTPISLLQEINKVNTADLLEAN